MDSKKQHQGAQMAKAVRAAAPQKPPRAVRAAAPQKPPPPPRRKGPHARAKAKVKPEAKAAMSIICFQNDCVFNLISRHVDNM